MNHSNSNSYIYTYENTSNIIKLVYIHYKKVVWDSSGSGSVSDFVELGWAVSEENENPSNRIRTC